MSIGSFFMAGGFPMIVILVFGLGAIASAARFAWMPEEGRLGHIVALCLGVLAMAFAGVFVDLYAVSVFVPQNDELAHGPDLPLVLIAGFGEAMTPAILGLSMCSVVALVAAVGLRRLPPKI